MADLSRAALAEAFGRLEGNGLALYAIRYHDQIARVLDEAARREGWNKLLAGETGAGQTMTPEMFRREVLAQAAQVCRERAGRWATSTAQDATWRQWEAEACAEAIERLSREET